MAIDFPGSPTIGQEVTIGAVVYKWDGTKWTAVPAGIAAGTKIEISNTKAEIIDTGSDGRFVVTTEGVERLRINSGGAAAFTAGTVSLPAITTAADLNTGIFFPAADTVAISEGGAEAARIDSSGRLLVGTTTSQQTNGAKLEIVGTRSGNGVYELALHCGPIHPLMTFSRGSALVSSGSGLGEIGFYGHDGTDKQSEAAQIRVDVDGTPGANDMPGRLVFSTTADGQVSATERMRIKSNGDIGVFGASDAFFIASSAAAGTSVNLIIGKHSATGTFSGTTSFVVRTNGNVENTNNSYGSISDAKLKENIVDATSQWSDLKALQIRKYNFKEETGQQTHTQIGLVAQEVELISPGLVSESPDRKTIEIPVLDADGNQVLDQDGNPQVSTEERETGTVTKSINYSVLYMKAVKALQEAMERIETLEAAVTALQQS